jgi:excinuclease ABC subunit A
MSFPLGTMICVTGVSGSGKSSLIHETLFPLLNHYFYKSRREPLPYKSIEGLEHIDKVIEVDQSPIGRTPRSNPATYTNLFTDIRTLFAELPEAKIRGYKPGRFSFNVKGGRCEDCEGAGMKKIEMDFLPDVHINCETCKGKRFNRETLEVRFKGKSIADILDMTVETALEFFENQPRLLRKVQTLNDVGLGYITLGQHATTLSGGEAQRVKLSEELSKRDTGKTLYILDEPTTGLHFQDIRHLLNVLNKLVEKGNTVLIIEHNLDVIKVADHIIDVGPEGGAQGGRIIAEGTPEKVSKVKGKLYRTLFGRIEIIIMEKNYAYSLVGKYAFLFYFNFTPERKLETDEICDKPIGLRTFQP